jgi:XisI protein
MDENHRYQVITMGWEGYRFVHDCPIHMDIIDGKVWVFQNMTEWEIDKLLQARGVPKSDIVAGFLPEELREQIDYSTVADGTIN